MSTQMLFLAALIVLSSSLQSHAVEYTDEQRRQHYRAALTSLARSAFLEQGRRGPGRLIEGITDFVRLRSGYVPGHWVVPGQGDRWDQGYDITARFLDYCNGLRNGFVAS
ncbi:hypothetical protein NL676_038861 [Syzygium grande]|nr:hypothetical protein NL676_038861 [Syzygium grande]